jgi:hypothetical protein
VRFDLAVHLGAELAALMGLASFSILAPPPGIDITNDSLPAIGHVHMLHLNHLFAAVPVLSQGFHLGGECAGQFVVSAVVGSCSIPDDHIDPRRWALFVARSILTEMRDGGRTC